MKTVMQFEDEAGALRLDLNKGPGGFRLLRGYDLAEPEVEYTWLTHPGYAGPTLAGSSLRNREITIAVQAFESYSVCETLWHALRTELDRKTNVIRFQPVGCPEPYFIDTYRSAMPPEAADPLTLYLNSRPVFIEVTAAPEFRGAGVAI